VRQSVRAISDAVGMVGCDRWHDVSSSTAQKCQITRNSQNILKNYAVREWIVKNRVLTRSHRCIYSGSCVVMSVVLGWITPLRAAISRTSSC